MKAFQSTGRHHRGRPVEGRVGQRAALRGCSSGRPNLPDRQAVQSTTRTPSRLIIVPEENWTDGMKNIAAYARFLAEELMGVKLVVTVVRTTNNFVACYGSGRLDFNLFRLGHKWFEQGINEDVDGLLIHEFGHQYSGDHLSRRVPRSAVPIGSQAQEAGPGEARSTPSFLTEVAIIKIIYLFREILLAWAVGGRLVGVATSFSFVPSCNLFFARVESRAIGGG